MTDESAELTRLTDNRRHLIPALFSWYQENRDAVHIGFIAGIHGVVIPARCQTTSVSFIVVPKSCVPQRKIRSDLVIINLSWSAVKDLRFHREELTCTALFNDKAFDLVVPYNAIWTIFLPGENGTPEERVFFEFHEEDFDQPAPKRVNHLRLVTP